MPMNSALHRPVGEALLGFVGKGVEIIASTGCGNPELCC